jgi:hypothetical protein
MRPEKAVISHKRKEDHPPLLPLLADEVLVYLSPMVNPVDALSAIGHMHDAYRSDRSM